MMSYAADLKENDKFKKLVSVGADIAEGQIVCDERK